MMKNLADVKLTKEFVSHVVAFSIAESGAMGEAGRILILTDEKEVYETYYHYDGVVKACFKVFSVFHQCTNNLLGKGNEIPKGWKCTYLGAGNYLFMMEWLDSIFYKVIGKDLTESEIYLIWIDTVNQILAGLETKEKYQKIRSVQRTDFDIVPFNAKRKYISGNNIRESLSVQWDSGLSEEKKIVAIGINPSTAQDGESDITMTKLCRFLDMYGFNNVTMLNLFESVSPDQSKINSSTKTDFNSKREILEKADVILLVWGVDGHEEEKKKALSVLMEYANKLYCIKNPKGRFPAHPSRMAYQSELIPMISAQDFLKCGMKVKRNNKKSETGERIMMECDLAVFQNDNFVMSLGAGTSAVCHFSQLADKGIVEAEEVTSSFNCNRDVYIKGMKLLQFIEKEYPGYVGAAQKKISNSETIYKIVCYDMS